jgi:hypothetical protein
VSGLAWLVDNGSAVPPASMAAPSEDGVTTSAAQADAGMSGQVVAEVATQTPVYTYYVNCATGNDANPGSQSRPWRSFTPVRNTSFRTNSALYLARGCTWNQALEVRGSPVASSRMLVTAYGTGSSPVISGARLAVSSPVSLLTPGVTLSGVTVTNAAQYAVQMFGAGDAVQDVTITRSGIGIRAMGAGSIIDHVSVADLHMILNSPGGSDDYGAVGFDIEAANVTLTSSSCTNCRASSYDWGYDGGFVEVWNYGDNLTISKNTASNTEGFLEIGGNARNGSARGVHIMNNTMTEVRGGLFIHGGDNFAIPTQNVLFSGNRLTNRSASTNAVFAGDISSLNLVKNVIVANEPLAFGAPQAHTGNVFYLTGSSAVGFTLAATDSLRPLSAAR